MRDAVLDLAAELAAALTSPRVRELLAEVLRDVVREELVRATPAGNELLTAEQAAAELKLTPAAVRKAAGRGQLPCVRLGRRLRFRRADLLNPKSRRTTRTA